MIQSDQTGYQTILMDPPWQERGGGKSKRGADRHYPLLAKKEIFDVVRNSGKWRPVKSCHLWMWATSNFLKDALWLIDVFGFEYKTSAVWVKARPVVRIGHFVDLGLQIGLGQYMRHAHEWLLLATRGPAMVPGATIRQPSVIFAQRSKHSEKPEESYRLIETTSPGPRLELFAREQIDGWDCWGNEVKPKGEKQ